MARLMRVYIKEGHFPLDRENVSQDLEALNEALTPFDGAKTEPTSTTDEEIKETPVMANVIVKGDVGICPFCGQNTSALWRESNEWVKEQTANFGDG
jgi:hypothetical protein